MQNKLWFKAKKYGWGWYPVSWQGWLVTIIYIIILLLSVLTIDENSPKNEVFFTFLIPIILSTITLIKIAYKTGEKPEWRWNDKKIFK